MKRCNSRLGESNERSEQASAGTLRETEEIGEVARP